MYLGMVYIMETTVYHHGFMNNGIWYFMVAWDPHGIPWPWYSMVHHGILWKIIMENAMTYPTECNGVDFKDWKLRLGIKVQDLGMRVQD